MSYSRLFDIPEYQQEHYPSDRALCTFRDGRWKRYSTEDCLNILNNAVQFIQELSVQKGDRIALVAGQSNPIFVLTEMAIMKAGAIPVPLHDNISPDEFSYVKEDAGFKYLFADEETTISEFSLDNVETFFFALLDKRIPHKKTEPGENVQVDPGDVAIIIYTSGSTGRPKGVALSHSNIISNIVSTIALIPINYKAKVASFLPLSHILEKMVVYTYMATGASVCFARMDHVIEDLRVISPNYFACVPRLMERFYEGIKERANQKHKLARRIIHAALDHGKLWGIRSDPGYHFKSLLYDLLVYRFWRRALGGRLKGVVVGGASMREDLTRMFCHAGIILREGYGLTETSPVVSFNRFEPGGMKIGTVGIPLPGVEVKIKNSPDSNEGEILVRGPNVMQGYWNLESATDEVIDQKGWFHTGDVGCFVDKKFLKVTGRAKELFKTSSGRFISPVFLENHLLTSPFISNCLIIGLNRPFVSAIVLPYFPEIHEWCKANKIHWTAPEYMIHNLKVVEKFRDVIDNINANLKREEQIRKFHLVSDEWSIEKGELTITQKPRRKVLEERYLKEINRLYT